MSDRAYHEFLSSKLPRPVSAGTDVAEIHPALFPFQQDIVRWATRRGRAAVWADTGLGKTLMQLEWARHSGSRALIVAPLAVAEQTIEEAQRKLGLTVRFCSDPPSEDGLWITNYQKLHRFVGRHSFDAIVLDESSILASLDGATRTLLIREFSSIPRRLCCTATPVPNDITEVANHSEFLGVLPRTEVLAHFFVHDSDDNADGGGGWRLKGHAREAFWRWVAHWAVYVRRPSDLGYEDDGFILPPLEIRDEVVPFEWKQEGELFSRLSGGIQGRSAARKASLSARVARAAAIIRESSEQWLVWHGLNDEGSALAAALGPESVLIEGSTPDEQKIDREIRWRRGDARVLITKPSMFGFGLNWQHCHNILYLGLSDSWQQYYQSIRRCWRFGQRHPVNVVIVTTTAETAVSDNVRRKEQQAADMAAGIVAAVKESQMEELHSTRAAELDYQTNESSGDRWRMLMGDSVERIRELPDDSMALSVFSPPFASLYTYSASDRDMGNSRDYDEFFRHFDFLIPELLRVTMPGRRACVHVQQVTTTKVTHGVIGWRDFRADVVRHFVSAGWIYDGEVVIDKCPQAQAIRTKSKALMFTQKNKDSSWSRPAMADYILLFRAPGENAVAVDTDVTNEEWIQWARPIWYGIRESDTLNAAVARDNADERHICPLQLETIERCIRLWSNKGETIFDPFAGIGSTGYVALQHSRKFVGIELKQSYYRTAVSNLASAVSQTALFGPLFESEASA
jgi:DNA modification methylase